MHEQGIETDHVKIAIAGTGFAGLGMAIKLKERGITDFTILERADDVGGTWRDNTYPGCACDVPSNLYSFSFALNPGWSRTFSEQPEIFGYLQRVADEHRIKDHVRFGHEVLEATWVAEHGHWHLRTSGGDLTADVFVSATGGLSDPKIPSIPGLDTFDGAMFHSATWNHDHDLAGERVAVVGTGASAIQFVPKIQPEVGKLTVFQRTPPWIMPRTDRPVTEGEHKVYRRVPGAQRAVRNAIYWARESFVFGFRHPRLMRLNQRIAEKHLERQVPDPELRRKLTPDYAMGCKRILLSNDYLPALAEPNVEVVTHGVREVRGRTIVAADGSEHEVDTIIFGTGFQIDDLPIAHRIRGRSGRTLADEWDGSPQAYNGTSVAGCPNLFILVGPNTGLGHNSIVYMIESQLEYVLGALDHLERTGGRTIEPRPEAQRAFNDRIQQLGEGTVWTAGGCASWYLDRNGRNSTLWPTFTYPFKRRLADFDVAAHAVELPERAADRELVPA